jgi:putative flippase GtrA
LRLIRDLYGRFGHLIHEVAKFGVVGASGALLQFTVQDSLHFGLGMEALTAEAIGIAGGMVLTFVGNRYWTYADRRSHGRELIWESFQFLVWCLLGLVIQLGLQWVVTYGLDAKSGLAYNLATALGIGIATVFRLWAYRTFVFKAVQPSAEAIEQLQPESLY